MKLRIFDKRYNVLIIIKNNYHLNKYQIKIKLI